MVMQRTLFTCTYYVLFAFVDDVEDDYVTLIFPLTSQHNTHTFHV